LGLTHVSIGPNVRIIESRAFVACRNVTWLMIPPEIEQIAGNAFLKVPLARLGLPVLTRIESALEGIPGVRTRFFGRRLDAQ
jgi:hypothetical protein